MSPETPVHTNIILCWRCRSELDMEATHCRWCNAAASPSVAMRQVEQGPTDGDGAAVDDFTRSPVT